MLLALEVIIGRRTIWLPKRWQQLSLGKLGSQKVLPFLMKRIRWFERLARPRLSRVLDQTAFRAGIGLIILFFTVGAFIAPPFSGLDTLPALGVVVISLGLLLEDAIILAIGIVIGLAGLGLIIGLGSLAGHVFRHLW